MKRHRKTATTRKNILQKIPIPYLRTHMVYIFYLIILDTLFIYQLGSSPWKGKAAGSADPSFPWWPLLSLTSLMRLHLRSRSCHRLAHLGHLHARSTVMAILWPHETRVPIGTSAHRPCCLEPRVSGQTPRGRIWYGPTQKVPGGGGFPN